jgi:hypothetical protein
MLEGLERYIKLGVGIERNNLAEGGEYHADPEEALLKDGSRQEDIWTGLLDKTLHEENRPAISGTAWNRK